MNSSAAPFTLYNPRVSGKSNKLVVAKELRKKLLEFHKLYRPIPSKTTFVDLHIDYARKKGVLALQSLLKRKYQCNLDDADASITGYTRIFRSLEKYYREYSPDKAVDIHRVFNYGKEKGLIALNAQLRQKYGESLSEYIARPFFAWKENWQSVLNHHHEESVSYELRRFYNFVETLPKKYPKKQDLEHLVNWAVNHSRVAVNEKLLEKYDFGLDDVRMIKGTSIEERIVHLRGQLIEFFQEHDPAFLGESAIGDNESVDGNANALQIEQMARDGVIRLEQLNDHLKRRYNRGLEDEFTKELRSRLVNFYASVGVTKSSAAIEKVVQFAKKMGLQDMNEKLNLTYGRGIPTDDL